MKQKLQRENIKHEKLRDKKNYREECDLVLNFSKHPSLKS